MQGTRTTLLKRFYESLPFDLTGAQKRSIKEIVADLRSPRAMNRLLQGDVGAGKTFVAMAAMLMAVDSGARKQRKLSHTSRRQAAENRHSRPFAGAAHAPDQSGYFCCNGQRDNTRYSEPARPCCDSTSVKSATGQCTAANSAGAKRRHLRLSCIARPMR